MSGKEVFPNPTVKQVVFEARFSGLFFLEDKIGDIQIELMKQFPKSKLLHTQQFVIGNLGPEQKVKEKPSAPEKIWRFQDNDEQITVDIQISRFSISSSLHKTYDQINHEPRFRDVLKMVLSAFVKATGLEQFSRIGLRYIDECPLPSKKTKVFKEFYDTAFNLKKFPLEDINACNYAVNVSREGFFMRYIESFSVNKDKIKYNLDFDGYASNVLASNWLSTTDTLHKIISKEYFKTIKEPVKKHMREL